MLKKYKIALFFIPWMLLLVTLLLWSLGIKMPFVQNHSLEVYNTSVVLERIETLGKLELVKYNFKEIFDYSAISRDKIRNNTYLRMYDFSPDLKVALIASGEAVGCIDLTGMDKEDIRIDNDTLYFRIPEPELCYHKLDVDKTRIYDFERSGFWSNIFTDDEEVTRTVEKAYREAEKQIRLSALESGILEQTVINAERVLKPILEEVSQLPVSFTHSPRNMELDGPYR